MVSLKYGGNPTSANILGVSHGILAYSGRFAYERGLARDGALGRWIRASHDKESFLVYLKRVIS